MTEISAKCRICDASLELTISEDYAAIGDRLKLLDKATCNRCYDLRDDRIKTVKRLEWVVRNLQELGTSEKHTTKREEWGRRLAILLRVYARNIADTERSNLVFPIDEPLQMILSQPDKSANIIEHLRKAIRTAITNNKALV